MKPTLLLTTLLCSSLFALTGYSQTKTVTVDANDVLNNNTKIVAQTSSGQIFFTGHQLGSGYYMPSGIFRAITDNTGGSNFFYDGVSGSATTFSVRSDGLGYFANGVGIGTNAPNSTFDLRGYMAVGGGVGGNIDPKSYSLNFLANSAQMVIGWNRSAGNGEADFIANQGAGSLGGFAFYNHDNSNNEQQLMWIRGDGNVAIGTTDPKGYKLAVNGSAIATSITVKANANWPDYVFKPNYSLGKLEDVKAYIDQHHHLPEVPSAAEIEEKGQNLGEMNQLLLKKIEELTLYLLENNFRQKRQEAMIWQQRLQIKQLRKKFDNLTNHNNPHYQN